MFCIIFKFKKQDIQLKVLEEDIQIFQKTTQSFFQKIKIKIMQVVFWHLLSSHNPVPLPHTQSSITTKLYVFLLWKCVMANKSGYKTVFALN